LIRLRIDKNLKKIRRGPSTAMDLTEKTAEGKIPFHNFSNSPKIFY